MTDADLHTFMFADMAGFTALTEAMGDEEAATVAEGFFDGARELLPRFGATEVKTIGDALMLEVGDAERAITLGIELAHEVGVEHGFPSVRIGMHTGPAIRRAEDWFGATVNLAARVSGAAVGGEVLLTDATRLAAGELEGVELVERGRRTFRNVAEPVTLFAAVPLGGAHDEAGLPIDPVCRMAVDPRRAAGRLVHDAREYYFCSLDCARRFTQAPERYVHAD